jgi:hypothetical protein
MRTAIRAALTAMACIAVPAVGGASDDPADYPHRVLRNDTGMRVTVMLVDADKGFYRGTRFDWSGHIAQAKYRGHTFFGLWRTPHDPTNFEHGVGPTDEFGIQNPPGYEQAKPDEPFLKIGVGLLKRIDEKPYHFATTYPVLNAGRWTQGSSGSRESGVAFQHELRTEFDWGYRYSKTVDLIADKPEFRIRRALKNVEGNDIKTASYNHNFIRIDDELIGPSYELELSDELQADVPAPAKFDGRRLTFTDKVEKPLMIYFKGQPRRTAKEQPGRGRRGGIIQFNAKLSFDITITNRRTGGQMVIEHPFDLSELRLWVTSTAICPEPFINVDLGPAESMSWTTTYRLGMADEAGPAP